MGSQCWQVGMGRQAWVSIGEGDASNIGLGLHAARARRRQGGKGLSKVEGVKSQ